MIYLILNLFWYVIAMTLLIVLHYIKLLFLKSIFRGFPALFLSYQKVAKKAKANKSIKTMTS